jgi:pseudouridine synthase
VRGTFAWKDPDGAHQPLAIDSALPLGPVPHTGRWNGTLSLAWWWGPPPLVAMHKPVGVVTSRSPDGGHPTVFSLLPTWVADGGLQPVGRLDVETSGLLLLTADGPLLQRLTHPRRAVARHYEVGTRTPPPAAAVEAMRTGALPLRDGHVPQVTTLDVAAAPDSEGLWWSQVVVTEGRYHEVRRMFAAMEAPVQVLRRIRLGPLVLDTLQGGVLRRPGAWCELDAPTQAGLHASVGWSGSAPSLQVRVGDPGPAA